MDLPEDQEPFHCVEVRFKNSRKEFFLNEKNLPLSVGEVVSTQAKSGHDVGIVSLTGELVRVQMKRKKVSPEDPSLPIVYRKSTQRDIDVWQKSRGKEAEIQKRAREIAIALGLEMKISDVEFQGDGSKATFYYTAEERVDFRRLIKDMARAFGIRIEMRQIGYRQEAQRLGGIGSCGRELCCATWLTDFRSVNTASARYQQLALNPQKLAGQCGKLKCCLNYELDSYLEALKDFPSQDSKLKTERGLAFCQKVDIFKETLWFSYKDQSSNWHALNKEQVQEILELNAKGKTVESLEEYSTEMGSAEASVSFENAAGQDSITRFDKPKRKKRRKRPNNQRKKSNANSSNPKKS